MVREQVMVSEQVMEWECPNDGMGTGDRVDHGEGTGVGENR